MTPFIMNCVKKPVRCRRTDTSRYGPCDGPRNKDDATVLQFRSRGTVYPLAPQSKQGRSERTGQWFSASSPTPASLSENVLETQILGPTPDLLNEKLGYPETCSGSRTTILTGDSLVFISSSLAAMACSSSAGATCRHVHAPAPSNL